MNKELTIFQNMVRIRVTELKLAELYKEQEMRTPTHFGIGQEACAAGVCEALSDGDQVYSHHRCHNHYLAQGGSVFKLGAELYGRVDGCSGGRGGSVHLTARDKGFIISSAILGQTLACATGTALAFKMDKKQAIAVTFFGDAAVEEGIASESFNYAAIHKLPVLYVCENNLYSTESPRNIRIPDDGDLCERARAFKLEAAQVDGNDVYAVYEATQKAVDHIRSGKGPYFLELMTYRWLEHVGPFYDHELDRSYRTAEELQEWKKNDPVLNAEAWLEKNGVPLSQIRSIHDEVMQKVNADLDRAKDSAWPEVSTLYERV
ncbi:MAG: acetoin dehydrogenase [Blastopirellula sp.]|nr:MAG: acetoin dehydrogenase [Blastopirellula sp.]